MLMEKYMFNYSNCCEVRIDDDITDLCPECLEHCEVISEYNVQGFDNRNQYLNFLVDQYEVDTDIVFELAESLGEEEDFDGLVAALDSRND